MLFFKRLDIKELEKIFKKVLDNNEIFDYNKELKIVIQQTYKNQSAISSVEKYETIKNDFEINKIPYNEFIKKIANKTHIPIQIIHKCLWEKMCEFSNLSKKEANFLLNYNTLRNIINHWQIEFSNCFYEKYDYNSLNFRADTSVLKGEEFVSELSQGSIGIYEKPIAYDSENLEHEIEKIVPPDKISVFGKLPRRSVKVPTYTGGSTSPDFLYAKEKDGKINLTLLIETKSEDMRMSEKSAIEAQKKLFKNIPNVEWKLIQNPDEVLKLLERM